VTVTAIVVSALGVSVSAALPAAAGAGQSTLSAGQELHAGQYLVSTSSQYTLNMQRDGNLVIYDNGKATWATNTNGTGSADFVIMQDDGNLVVYTGAGKPVWASNTVGSGSHNNLVMQDDGNLVIYTASGKAVWASNTVTGSGGSSVGNAIVKAAAGMHNTPYCYDGGNTSGPSHGDGNVDGATKCGSGVKGFDCTGLALYAVYQATHIVLPHGQGIENVRGGTRITSESNLAPGDIILFGGTWTDYEHVGIYAGGGKMWDANIAYPPYHDGVQERSLAWETAALNFIGAIRF
jgi:cell wall-associated NlpC family hydrolase